MERCPLRRASDSDWGDIKTRVDDLVRELDERPVSVVGGHDGAKAQKHNSDDEEHRTNIVGGYEVLSAFRRAVYNAAEYPRLARALADAVDGRDFTGVLEVQFRRGAGTAAGLLCPRPGGPPPVSSLGVTFYCLYRVSETRPSVHGGSNS